MGYPDAAWERAMTVREMMLKAVSGELHWFQAADILGWSPRTLRCWRTRYEAHGDAGLVDKRSLRPSGESAGVERHREALGAQDGRETGQSTGPSRRAQPSGLRVVIFFSWTPTLHPIPLLSP